MAYPLTRGQQIFSARLSKDTGLDVGVVQAWVYSEENGAAAAGYQARNFHNWLNIGITGSGSYGLSNSFWQDPVSAADATAAWMKGQLSIPGYGKASSGIQQIPRTAGQPAGTQLQTIQRSGWASSGYPNIGYTYVKGGFAHVSESGFDSVLKSIITAPAQVFQGVTGKDVHASPTGSGSVVGQGLSLFGISSKDILRGLEMVAGFVFVVMGLFLLTKQVGLGGFDLPGPVGAAATATARQGDAAIGRGGEVTRTSAPQPLSNVDRRRTRSNARRRVRETPSPPEYGEIPF